jgi:hypothetical protein
VRLPPCIGLRSVERVDGDVVLLLVSRSIRTNLDFLLGDNAEVRKALEHCADVDLLCLTIGTRADVIHVTVVALLDLRVEDQSLVADDHSGPSYRLLEDTADDVAVDNAKILVHEDLLVLSSYTIWIINCLLSAELCNVGEILNVWFFIKTCV